MLEAEDDEEKESEVDGEVEERVTQRAHETWRCPRDGMRDKFEPQCVCKESVKEQRHKLTKKRETTRTKDLQCMKTHALASTTSTLTLTCSPSVSSHFTHCWVLHCASCRQFLILVAVTIYSILTCTQIPERVHTAKMGLLRCCLYNLSLGSSRAIMQCDCTSIMRCELHERGDV